VGVAAAAMDGGGNYEGPGSGLYKSEDWGENWRELTKDSGEAWAHQYSIAPSDPDRNVLHSGCE